VHSKVRHNKQATKNTNKNCSFWILFSQRELQIILSTELAWGCRRSPIHVELSILMHSVRMKCEWVKSFGKENAMYSKSVQAGILHVSVIGFNTKLNQFERTNTWLLQQKITNYEKHSHILQMTICFCQVKSQGYQSWKLNHHSTPNLYYQVLFLCSNFNYTEFQDSMLNSIFGHGDINPFQQIYRYIHKAPTDM
jgi:hypothetical protein